MKNWEINPPCVVYVSPLAFIATLKLSTVLPVKSAAIGVSTFVDERDEDSERIGENLSKRDEPK
jgi:hypothetical protein